MKTTENQKQQQTVQTEQKDQPVIRVQSNLRAGAASSATRGHCI